MPDSAPAYLIGHITIKDEAKWARYRAGVPATLEPWGGELVFRGRRAAVLAGHHDATDTVVLRFPDLASLQGWFNSSAYQALIPVREQAADVVLVAYES
ncbi:DUF1330 domain-containing protein [Azoarcus sp. KH32C]|uniref:DUF1330 domain-containing protein n=1 Tax=Azoarcus sp. KH32C TaxID=748247 RepID=UPI00034A37B6|nr:DUF1330 domain-containing protein [Azoarcus sp. KH32C]